jgi:ABC-type branched-subunit amino acid transport system ATPase component/branched-subunit amino acid ABC-type transport system permease component
MTAFLQYSAIGIGGGAIYALLANGLVIIYRASGVVNLAQCAIGVLAGMSFASMTENGGWGTWPAFAILVAASGLLTLTIYWVAIAPLRRASQLTRMFATLAVLLIIEGAATLHWGSTPLLVPPFLSTELVHVGGLVITGTQIILVAIACVSTAVLWAAVRFTLPGIAIRAVAENRRATSALGWSPNLLSSVSWTIGGALGGAAGILITPITGVQVSSMTSLIVTTLAAALVGGFVSFPRTLLGAILIGVAQALVSGYVSVQGAADALPFIVIVIVLSVRGNSLPTRGHVAERLAELGTGRTRPIMVVPPCLVLGILMVTVFSPTLDGAVTTSLAFAIVLLSMVVLTGYCGQLSLAQLCFGGIGALFAGRLVESASWSFVPAAAVAIIATVPIGVLFALPALRTRGMTLAIVTLGLGATVDEMVFQNSKLIGGLVGTPIGQPSLFGLSIDSARFPERYGLLTLMAFVLCGFAVANVRRGRIGRRLIAVRANERAAAAVGVNVYGTKLYAFGLSAALASIGGILMAFQFGTIDYSVFTPFDSILAASSAVIGGVGFVNGALQGAPLAPGGVGSWLVDLFGTSLSSYLELISGVILLVMLLQNPSGLASSASRIARTVRAKLPRRGPRTPPPMLELNSTEVTRVRPEILEVRDLVVRYGGVTAVDGVSITLRPGRISGLIGPNGSGKTSMIDAISGFVRPAAGSVVLAGRAIEDWPVHRRVRAGMTRSFQSLELFEGITVRENLLSASEGHDPRAYATDLVKPGKWSYAPAALAAIREFGLQDDLDRQPTDLPYGRRRLVAIARALGSEPSVLLLDEPAAGLDENEAAEIATLVRGLATSWGIAILLVEHDMAFVMSVCDDITVIDFGRPIGFGSPDEVRRDPAVIAAYLGDPDQPPALVEADRSAVARPALAASSEGIR